MVIIYTSFHKAPHHHQKEYLKNRMHPNHLEFLKAGKKYLKDDTYEIPENEIEDKKQQEVKS